MKKLLTLALALVLCLGLTAPVLAADTLNGNQLSFGDWGDGPSLTLTGVVGMTKTPIDPTEIYDVEVGGSLVLEMTYPAGTNRIYRIWNSGFYLLFPPNPSDFTDWENSDILRDSWDPLEETEEGYFDKSSGKTQFVYNFTEADMGQKNGYDKISYPYIYWFDDADGDGDADNGSEGSAYFGVRVVPAKSSSPDVPKVQVSSQPLTLDGKAVNAQAYNIGGSNFFKLRDVAMMLNGTGVQFSVGYDAGTRAVTAKSGEAYTAIGGELTHGEDKSASCVVSSQPFSVDGKKLDVTVYNIGGSNYFMLRDLGEALGFGVDYDAATRTVLVTTK